MLCPVCEVDRFVLEFERVEIDWCPECAGVWLDSGELELIGQRAGALHGELLGALETGKSERPGGGRRRCPICRKKLREVKTESEPPIVLDRCPAEHGLWFDRGELEAVVATAGADQDNALVRFFAELGGSGAKAEDT